MENQFSQLKKSYNSIIQSNEIVFAEIAGMKKIMGVYIIYSPNNEILYIGSTNNFHVRFGTDLKHETTHTLVKKFIKQGIYKDRKEVKTYLTNECRFKIHICQNKREAEALEHYCIWVLNPKYNK